MTKLSGVVCTRCRQRVGTNYEGNKCISCEVELFPTKNKEGFTPAEVKEILKKFKNINMEKFEEALMCNTGLLKDGVPITYQVDIEKALRCGVENRSLTAEEWD